MKRWFYLIGLLALAKSAQAGPFEWQARQDSVVAAIGWTDIAASTTAIAVDLSDTVNFPHKNTGNVDIVGFHLDIGKPATSSGTFKVGVVTRVDATNGDVRWFYSHVFGDDAAGSPTHYSQDFNYPEAAIRARVSASGTTPYLVSTSSTMASTIFQTDVRLPTSAGNEVAGVGDIVVQYTTAGSSATDISFELMYYTEK